MSSMTHRRQSWGVGGCRDLQILGWGVVGCRRGSWNIIICQEVCSRGV